MPRNTPDKIRKLERERGRLLQILLRSALLLKGSLSLVKRRCGKPSCHCNTEPAHPTWVLCTTTEGQRRCQVVRKADVDEVRQRVEVYKRFRDAIRRLKTTEEQQKRLLRGLMDKRNAPYE